MFPGEDVLVSVGSCQGGCSVRPPSDAHDITLPVAIPGFPVLRDAWLITFIYPSWHTGYLFVPCLSLFKPGNTYGTMPRMFPTSDSAPIAGNFVRPADQLLRFPNPVPNN